MTLKDYLAGLDPAAKRKFAARAKTTVPYLAQLSGGHRMPGHELAKRLVAASDNKISLASLRPDIWGDAA